MMFILFLALVGSSVLARDPIDFYDDVIASSPYPVAHSDEEYPLPHQNQFDEGINQPLPRSKYGRQQPKSMLQKATSKLIELADNELSITTKPSSLGKDSLEPRSQDCNIHSLSEELKALLSKYGLENRNSHKESPIHRSRRQTMFVINASDYRDLDEYEDNSNDVNANPEVVEKKLTTQPPLEQTLPADVSWDVHDGVKLQTVEPKPENRNDATPQQALSIPDDSSEEEQNGDFQKSSNPEERTHEQAGATIRREESSPDKLEVNLVPSSSVFFPIHKTGRSSRGEEESNQFSVKDSEEDGLMVRKFSTTTEKGSSSNEEMVDEVEELMRRRGIVYNLENMPPQDEIVMIEEIERQLNELIDEMLSGQYEDSGNITAFVAQLQKYRRRLQTRRENLVSELRKMSRLISSEEETKSEEVLGEQIIDEFVRQRAVVPADEIKIIEEMVVYLNEQIDEVSSKKTTSPDDGAFDDDVSSYVAEIKKFRHKILNRRRKLIRELLQRVQLFQEEKSSEETPTTESDVGGDTDGSRVPEAFVPRVDSTDAITDEIDFTTQSDLVLRLFKGNASQPPRIQKLSKVPVSDSSDEFSNGEDIYWKSFTDEPVSVLTVKSAEATTQGIHINEDDE